MDELILELKNYNNALIMAGAWVGIEMFWTPLVHRVIMSQALLKWRKSLKDTEAWGKKVSGILWCSAAVWIPSAQPALCEAEHDGTCQTVFARVSLGLILGFALQGGHWAGKKGLMAFTGRGKKHTVTCINCKTKSKLDDWGDKCPSCSKDPHNIENGNGEGAA